MERKKEYPRLLFETLKSKSEVESFVSRTRNLSSDANSMFEVLTDIFPGIEECIFDNLTVRESCTNEGLMLLKSKNLSCLTKAILIRLGKTIKCSVQQNTIHPHQTHPQINNQPQND